MPVSCLLGYRRPGPVALGDVGLSTEVCRGLFSRRDTIQGESQLSRDVAGGFSVDSEGLPMDIVQIVAFEMVARVFWGPCPGEDAR